MGVCRTLYTLRYCSAVVRCLLFELFHISVVQVCLPCIYFISAIRYIKTYQNMLKYRFATVMVNMDKQASNPGGVTWVFRGAHTFVIKIKKYP